MKKILIVVANISKHQLINQATCYSLIEINQFFKTLKIQGWEVDFVSASNKKTSAISDSFEFVSEENFSGVSIEEFESDVLSNILNPQEIRVKDYQAIYYQINPAVLVDFPNSKIIQAIAMNIQQNNGMIGAINLDMQVI